MQRHLNIALSRGALAHTRVSVNTVFNMPRSEPVMARRRKRAVQNRVVDRIMLARMDACSDAFWRGILHGLASPGRLFDPPHSARRYSDFDSVAQAWQSIGNVMHHALTDFGREAEFIEQEEQRAVKGTVSGIAATSSQTTG